MNLYRYEVGKPFQEGVTRYPESIRFDFTSSGGVFLLFLSQLSSQEIESIRKGALKIGFIEKENIIFLLVKFDDMPWFDAPYSVHMSQPFEFEDLEEGKGYRMQIFLVNADTGILEAIRLVGMGTEWSRRFREAVERQKEKPFDKVEYDYNLQRVYGSMSTKDMARELSLKNMYKAGNN